MVSQGNRLPVSQLLHASTATHPPSADGTAASAAAAAVLDEAPVKKSREDWRRAKELEEARKAGTAPAAVDEDGRDINPHIPQYISNAPWYYGTTGPTLRHQRPQEDSHRETSGIDEWYRRGVDKSRLITRYRAGACENCGAQTHKRTDCLERPRKVGAKYSGALLAYDDHVQPTLVSDFDGKRDRWAGYDPVAHKDIVREYQKVEEAKQRIKSDKLKQHPDAELSDDEADEDRYVDEVDMPGTKVDSKQRITVRNLRIREDTAKYLRNLDPNSAYYDPKTRSMRDNPTPGKNANESEFAGENFVRFTGDTNKHSQAQMFAWDAYGKGVDVHLLAEPTKLELLQHEYDKKKDQFKSQAKNTILDSYGGGEHLKAPPRTLLLAQSEEYVEYSRGGKVIRGQEKLPNRSRYEEDVRINNHTSTWGSWWSGGEWGYQCCRSTLKGSYCVGADQEAVGGHAFIPDCVHSAVEEMAKRKKQLLSGEARATEAVALTSTTASETADGQPQLHQLDEADISMQSGTERQKTSNKKNKRKNKKRKDKSRKSKHGKVQSSSSHDSDANDEVAVGTDGLRRALRAEEKHQAKVAKLLSRDERKRPYNSMAEVKKPSENEIEAYLMKRRREDDPLMR